MAIRLSSYHGNIGLFVVKENFRGCGIGTTIFDMAVAHLGEHRNKGLSAVPQMFHIYRDRAKFNKVASWEVLMFKLDGKRLLANLANFLKSSAPKNPDVDEPVGAADKPDDRSDCDTASITNSTNSSSRCDSEELNAINENEAELFAGHPKQSKHLHNSLSSPLKDITGEENGRSNVLRDYDWIRRKKSELSLLKDHKFHTFNQLINYSAPRPHLNSLIFSTKVFPSTGKTSSANSPSISLPSLLLNGSGDTGLSAFDKPPFGTPFGGGQPLIDSRVITRTQVIDYSNYWLHKLIDFDEQLNGYNRSKIVRLSVNEEHSRTKLAVIGEQIVGYGTAKYSLQDTWLIAPLYAQTAQIASDLIKAFVRSMSIQQLVKGFILKLPNGNHKAIELMESLGFEKQDYVVTR